MTQSQESHCGSKLATSANCPIASLIPRFLICKMKSEDVDFFSVCEEFLYC